MMFLEQEFEMLRRLVLDEIRTKAVRGQLSNEEAEALRTMVVTRMVAPEEPSEPSCDSSYDSCEIGGYPGRERLQRAAAEEKCPEHGEHPDKCGWSQSMGYHCD